jgi:hypothetical protein
MPYETEINFAPFQHRAVPKPTMPVAFILRFDSRRVECEIDSKISVVDFDTPQR